MKKMKIIFYIKKEKTNAEGLSAIYSKIAVGNTATTFTTGKYISPQRWETTNHLRNVIKKDDAIKSYLKTIEDRAEAIFLDLQKRNSEEATAEQVKSLLFGAPVVTKSNSKTVLQAIDLHNNYFATLVAKDEKASGTLERYNTIRSITVEFIKNEYGCNDLPLHKMDKHFVFRFDTYLRTKKTYKNNIGCGHNTTVKYIRNLKTIFNFVVKQGGWLDINPFLVYDERIKPVSTTFLEEEELESIENKVFNCERLDTVKNIFLFSCYTSYAPVDVMKLTWSNVVIMKDAEKMIKAKRTKTKTEANVLLLPPAEKIINHYRNDPRCANENRLLPKLSNQKMNAYLKEIADLCGINKNLTWYVSRHTFATTVMLSQDVPIEVVSSAMGHTNIRQTQHYAKIREKFVISHMKKLKERYN